ncbi:uncharacterized protein LOC141850918 isoform X1 [Brevipalpus obovatus]|uniref:uncharacterized protein LOC141850917 isoform X3 n=1 Tax=Brevipalpus obovatus TaxID=246614 RepID=UPI003D9E63A5
MAAKEVQQSLINEATSTLFHQYSSFLTEFDSKLAHLHQENIKYINSSIDYGAYFNPYINEYTNEWTEFTNLLRTCGNMELNRVLMVLANLCQEMYSLSRIGLEQCIYPLALYGEERKVSYDDQEINENGLDGPERGSLVEHWIENSGLTVQQDDLHGTIERSKFPQMS